MTDGLRHFMHSTFLYCRDRTNAKGLPTNDDGLGHRIHSASLCCGTWQEAATPLLLTVAQHSHTKHELNITSMAPSTNAE